MIKDLSSDWLENKILTSRIFPTILEVGLNKGERVAMKIKNSLLDYLNAEVDERFGGNKTMAAKAAGLSRSRFTEICNASEQVSMEKLIEIGTQLGWDLEITVKRK